MSSSTSIGKHNTGSAFSKNCKIGVLGGIGPEATGEFYSKLIKRLQKTGLVKSNADFPQIIINSIPAPELIYENISGNDLKPYIEGLRFLDEVGVDFIAMVCNTVHLYHSMLQKKIRAPIIDLRHEVKQQLNKKKIKSAVVLGTPLTVKGLYRFEGIRFFRPTGKELNQLSNAIFSFNKGINKKYQIKRARKICHKYLDAGAETAILACTELALMLGNEKISKINTIDVLVGATVNRFSSLKYYRRQRNN